MIMFLVVDHGKVLRSTVNELQQNSDAFSDCFVERRFFTFTTTQFAFDLCGRLSVVCQS